MQMTIGACRCQKMLDPGSWSYRCWQPNPGPLQKQDTLLIPGHLCNHLVYPLTDGENTCRSMRSGIFLLHLGKARVRGVIGS